MTLRDRGAVDMGKSTATVAGTLMQPSSNKGSWYFEAMRDRQTCYQFDVSKQSNFIYSIMFIAWLGDLLFSIKCAGQSTENPPIQALRADMLSLSLSVSPIPTCACLLTIHIIFHLM